MSNKNDINNLDPGTVEDNKSPEEMGAEIAKQVFAPIQQEREGNIRRQVSEALDEVLAADQDLKKKYDFVMNAVIKKAVFDAIMEKGESESNEEILKAALKIFEKIKI